MALEIMDQAAAANGANGTDKETLYMLGGVALVIFGAGLGALQFHGAPLSFTVGRGRFRVGRAAGH